MKNACIVLKQNKSELCQADFTKFTGVFTQKGYFFDEIRILTFSFETFPKTVDELKNNYQNLLVLADKSLLQEVSTLLNSFPQGEFIRANKDGMGIFRNGEFTLFLSSQEELEECYLFLQETCVSHLRQKGVCRQEKFVLKTVGAPKKFVEEVIFTAKRLSGSSLVYNYTSRYDDGILEIFYDQTVSRILTDDILRLFVTQLGEYLYSLEEKSLEHQLVDILRLRGKKIAVAESFTGGGVGKRIVSVSGASEVYFEGVNTYSELSKMKRLGVSEYALKSFGAVSDQTAYEMAAGLIAQGDADITIATTGIAGPKSDRTEFPVGLCYVAIGTRERVHVFQFKFEGTREEITEKAINHALFLAYRQLKDM